MVRALHITIKGPPHIGQGPPHFVGGATQARALHITMNQLQFIQLSVPSQHVRTTSVVCTESTCTNHCRCLYPVNMYERLRIYRCMYAVYQVCLIKQHLYSCELRGYVDHQCNLPCLCCQDSLSVHIVWMQMSNVLKNSTNIHIVNMLIHHTYHLHRMKKVHNQVILYREISSISTSTI